MSQNKDVSINPDGSLTFSSSGSSITVASDSFSIGRDIKGLEIILKTYDKNTSGAKPIIGIKKGVRLL